MSEIPTVKTIKCQISQLTENAICQWALTDISYTCYINARYIHVLHKVCWYKRHVTHATFITVTHCTLYKPCVTFTYLYTQPTVISYYQSLLTSDHTHSIRSPTSISAVKCYFILILWNRGPTLLAGRLSVSSHVASCIDH